MFAKSLILAALPILSLAQGVVLPSCGLTCIVTQVGSMVGGCTSVTDLNCICTSEAFNAAALQCFINSCSPSDTAQSIAFSANTCQQNGTPLDTTSTPAGITFPAGYPTTLPANGGSGASAASGSGDASAALSSASAAYSSGLASASAALTGDQLASVDSALFSSYSAVVVVIESEYSTSVDLPAPTSS